jgi:hypothetical protein
MPERIQRTSIGADKVSSMCFVVLTNISHNHHLVSFPPRNLTDHNLPKPRLRQQMARELRTDRGESIGFFSTFL